MPVLAPQHGDGGVGLADVEAADVTGVHVAPWLELPQDGEVLLAAARGLDGAK